MKFTEFTESNKHILKERPATAGALGSNLSPEAFESRYGMTPAQAETAINNVVELNPGYKSPGVKDSLRQYMLENPKALTAANQNVKPPIPKFRINPGAFARGALGRALGAIGMIFYPSDLGDGTITPEMQLQMDFEKHLAETNPSAYVEMIDTQWDSLTDEQKKENEQYDPRNKQEYKDALEATRSFDPSSPDAPVIEPPVIEPVTPEPVPPEPSYPEDEPVLPSEEPPPGWPADIPWNPNAPEGPPATPPNLPEPPPAEPAPVIPDLPPETPPVEEPPEIEPPVEEPTPDEETPPVEEPEPAPEEEPAPTEEPAPDTAPEPEPEPAPEEEPAPAPDTAPDTAPEEEPAPEPTPEPAPEPAPGPIPIPAPIPVPRPGPGTTPKPRTPRGFKLPKINIPKLERLPPRLIHLNDPLNLKRNVQ